ncbi:hypothetical protein CFP71_25125 [Amycolatopsis thailandensis]|uniref:Uncharacterized protein n=1 Tax=Amycolatopsis thailandensis TaxID=589330 RepID=A0A229RYP2_9PSEU|nr:hypothetical protein CFP71_25125 [Amycolatopsis thailandensis]
MIGHARNLYSRRSFTATFKITSAEAPHASDFRLFPHKDQPSHHRRASVTGLSRTATDGRLSSADRPINAQYV